jgi:hypothetical protein
MTCQGALTRAAHVRTPPEGAGADASAGLDDEPGARPGPRLARGYRVRRAFIEQAQRLQTVFTTLRHTRRRNRNRGFRSFLGGGI